MQFQETHGIQSGRRMVNLLPKVETSDPTFTGKAADFTLLDFEKSAHVEGVAGAENRQIGADRECLHRLPVSEIG